MRYVANSLEELQEIAADLAQRLPKKGVVLLEGEMGAGKTTLVAALCRAWGIQDPVGSPTYALVHEYHGKEGRVIYHFDLYRLESPEEALDFGIEDYFSETALSLVEWPDRLAYLRPEDALIIRVDDCGGKREISLEA